MSKNLPKLSKEEIQTIDRALEEFKQALNLPPRNPGRMHAGVSLRRAGFTANQIITLSRGAWPRQTVAHWVKSTSAAANAPAERAIAILADAVEKNCTLDQLLLALKIQNTLTFEGISLEDLLEAVKALTEGKLSLHEFIEYYKMMKEEGLTFANIKSHLKYKQSLEKQGFGLDSLRQIQAAAQKFDNPDNVLEAIDTYQSIEELKETLADLRESNQNEATRRAVLNTGVAALETTQRTLQTEINNNQNTIQQLNSATELGYNLETLRNLQEQTRLFGGIGKLLTALAKYTDLIKLEITISETQNKLNNLNGDRIKLEAENLQYKTEIETTRTLIRDHKLGLQALQELLKLCEKYGAPEQVFRAVAEYANIQEIREELQTLRNQYALESEQEKRTREKVDSIIPYLQKKIEELEGKFTEEFNRTALNVRNEIKSLLDAAHEVDKAYEERERKAEQMKAWMELLNMATDPSTVTNVQVLNTVQLILTKLAQWLRSNKEKFGFAGEFTTPIQNAERCETLAAHLGKLSTVFHHEPAS